MTSLNNKTQAEKFKTLAREAACEDDEAAFDKKLKRIVGSERQNARVCPECGHIFKGNGWDGIDAHWHSKHEDIMPYEEAWPLLKAGNYKTD